MKANQVFRLFILLLMINASIVASEQDFDNLLKCNLSHLDVASCCNVTRELDLYEQALQNESNYAPVPALENWIDVGTTYPTLHPTHQIIIDIVRELDISTLCEIGAGAGKVSKYLYAQNPNLLITCIEHNSEHLKQMKENFVTRTNVLLPDIKVNATIVKGCLPNLSSIKSNSFDFIFTCTVMMHLPFIPAVKSAIEIHRLSNKYILHIENKNDGNEWYNMAVVKPKELSPINYLGIDYVALYEKLGVKTLKYYEYKDPFSPAIFIVYLGEKSNF